MSAIPDEARGPGPLFLLLHRVRFMKARLFGALAHWALKRAVGKSALVSHAEEELRRLGFEEDPESFENTLAVIRAFTLEGHSGGSASIMIPAIQDLLRFRPLTALTGEDGEWIYTGRTPEGVGTFQNRRFSEVFREVSVDSTKTKVTSYWAFGRVFRDEDGSIYTRQPDSRVEITFPWSPPEEPTVVETYE